MAKTKKLLTIKQMATLAQMAADESYYPDPRSEEYVKMFKHLATGVGKGNTMLDRAVGAARYAWKKGSSGLAKFPLILAFNALQEVSK